MFIFQYSESALYLQLCFYQHIFDFDKARSQLSDKEKGKTFISASKLF